MAKTKTSPATKTSTKTVQTKTKAKAKTTKAAAPAASPEPAPAPAPEPVTAPVTAPAPVASPAQSGDSTNVTDQFAQLLNSLSEVVKTVKSLQSDVKTLQKQVARERRELEKAAKKKKKDPNKAKRQPSGFAVPTNLSPELCTFLSVDGDTKLARQDVTKLITTYIKDHNLQNPEKKTQILPDAKLKKLLGPLDGSIIDKEGRTDKDKGYTYFNLQRYMKHHYLKPTVQATA